MADAGHQTLTDEQPLFTVFYCHFEKVCLSKGNVFKGRRLFDDVDGNLNYKEVMQERHYKALVTVANSVSLFIHHEFYFLDIATAALLRLRGTDGIVGSKHPDIMADAAYVMLTRDSRSYTGNFAIDEDILKEIGVTDLEQYTWVPGNNL